MFSLLPNRHPGSAHTRPPQPGDKLDVVEFLDLTQTKHIVLIEDGSERSSIRDEDSIRVILNALRKSGRLINVSLPNSSAAVLSFHLEGQNRHGWTHFDVDCGADRGVLHREGLGIALGSELKAMLHGERASGQIRTLGDAAAVD